MVELTPLGNMEPDGASAGTPATLLAVGSGEGPTGDLGRVGSLSVMELARGR